MKTFIFGFGWEISGFILYMLAWGWIGSLLEEKITPLKGRVVVSSIIAIMMLHPFVVNYPVLVFWLLVTLSGLLLWSQLTTTYLEKLAPWIDKISRQVIRVLVLSILFVLARYLIFQFSPEKMWYYI